MDPKEILGDWIPKPKKSLIQEINDGGHDIKMETENEFENENENDKIKKAAKIRSAMLAVEEDYDRKSFEEREIEMKWENFQYSENAPTTEHYQN